MIRIPGLALVLAALLLNAAVAHAHTLAGTMISVAVTRPGIVTITIAAEADPLIVELETLAGTPASEPPMTNDERRARIESLLPTLLTNVEASIARQRLVLEIQDVTVDDTAQTEIRVHGRMPPGPTTFTWRSTFIFGAYRITIIGRAGEVIEWLQGAQTSTPIALEARPADDERSALRLTGNRIGHSLAMSALVVYVLCRRRTAQKLSGRKPRSR